MWKCPTCAEQIEDQFDSCWNCTKTAGAVGGPERSEPRRSPLGFWTYYRRGWIVLLLVVLVGLFDQILLSLLKLLMAPLGQPDSWDRFSYALVSFGIVLLVLPAASYWFFVLLFGHRAWPFAAPGKCSTLPREDRAFASLAVATRLESRGRIKEALEKYRAVVDEFPGTSASSDAQKSLESLRTKIG